MPDTELHPFHAWFTDAVDLLGGQRATARYLGISERQMRGLVSGERSLHDGFLRDTAAALVTHADKCRTVERKLFSAAIATAAEKPHHKRYDQRDAGDANNR